MVGHHRLEVGPAGHLGHDAAEPGVLVHAGRDRVGQQRVPRTMPMPVSSQEVSMPEHQRLALTALHVLITSASVLLGW